MNTPMWHMLNGKQNLGAESYKRCKKRKFCCFSDNMEVYILNLRLAALFLKNLPSFFFFLPLLFQMLHKLWYSCLHSLFVIVLGLICLKNCSCRICYKSNTVSVWFFFPPGHLSYVVLFFFFSLMKTFINWWLTNCKLQINSYVWGTNVHRAEE